MASNLIPLPGHTNYHHKQRIFCIHCKCKLLPNPKLPPPSNSNYVCKSAPAIYPIPLHRDLCRKLHILQSSSTSGATGEVSEERRHAREAVSAILQEHGASLEESIQIASNSPNYLQMLIDSVRDLDELSLWDSWSTSKEEGESKAGSSSPSTLKKKMYVMAKKKGDKGMLPFLESVGLTLSTAMHVARSFSSSNTLPHLIRKVKYVKEIFFPNSDAERFIGKNARRMMVHLSIPIDEDLQQTLSFFHKIQARRGGMDTLASKDASFRYLIESFPRLLMLPLESHMMQMVRFFGNLGIPKESMSNILLLFPPVIFYDIETDIKPRLQAFGKVCIADRDVGRMLLKYPWILSTSILENYEEILSFLHMEKIPKASVSRAIKSWPHILGSSISKLNLMMLKFGELGVTDKRLGKVLATSPQLLLKKPQEFLQVVSFLEDLGLDEESIGEILVRCPEIFGASIDRTLKPKLEFLSGIGVPTNQLPRVIRRYPQLFVSDIDNALLPRVKYLMQAGLSREEVLSMLYRFSPLLGYSVEEVLQPKLDFLVNTMGKPVKAVVEYPRYFSYSLEKKIKPRYFVLKRRNVTPSLKDILAKNDEEFAEEFMGVGRMLIPPPSP